MPFLQNRLAVLVFLCLLAPCFWPQQAALAQIAEGPGGNASAEVTDDAEENPRPAVLPPMRKAQTPPQVLRRSILEVLVKKEEALRLEDEAAERLAAEERARQEREEALREQREAGENARVLRERAQARAKALGNAVQSTSLPPVGVIPAKADWPVSGLVEDPAWNGPDIARFFQKPYTEAEVKAAYRHLLNEAAHGNPRAMAVLAYAYERWGAGISGSFFVLYPPMHNGAYWRNWALRLTSPDWVDLRLAELSLEQSEKLEYYRASASAGNSEAIYRLALLEDRPDLIIAAAAAGHARACSEAAFNLGMGGGGFPSSPQRAAAYWWRGALAGDERSMLVCSEFFYQGQNGFPKDERRAYIFALLALETLQQRGVYASEGTEAALLPTVERHLNSLAAALGLSWDDRWKLRQELKIFRAAPEEQRRASLDNARPWRAATLRELENELDMLREVLRGEEDSLNERQILAKFEQALADNELEQLRQSRLLLAEQRERDNQYFFWLGAAAVLALLGTYLGLRLDVYARVVRLMCATGKERI